jgi:hypothetical protein
MKSPNAWWNIRAAAKLAAKEHKPDIVKRRRCNHFDGDIFIESWKMEMLHANFREPDGGRRETLQWRTYSSIYLIGGQAANSTSSR